MDVTRCADDVQGNQARGEAREDLEKGFVSGVKTVGAASVGESPEG